MHRHSRGCSLYPRGPRSGLGSAVPVHHRLFDLIRPTRRNIATSPLGGLYAMPSLCRCALASREWFRAFVDRSFSACRPLRPRGVHRLHAPSSFVDGVGLRPLVTDSALPNFPPSASGGPRISGLHWFASLQPVELLASLGGSDRVLPQPTKAFTPGLPTGRSPFPPPGMTTVATGQFPPAGLSPTGLSSNRSPGKAGGIRIVGRPRRL
jgi:hypothetical protein